VTSPRWHPTVVTFLTRGLHASESAICSPATTQQVNWAAKLASRGVFTAAKCRPHQPTCRLMCAFTIEAHGVGGGRGPLAGAHAMPQKGQGMCGAASKPSAWNLTRW
jgi:hypothetical protein